MLVSGGAVAEFAVSEEPDDDAVALLAARGSWRWFGGSRLAARVLPPRHNYLYRRQIFLAPLPLVARQPPGYTPPFSLGVPPAAGMPAGFGAWAQRLIDVVSNVLQGKINATLDVTLAANAATSTITDARISAFSALTFMPLTANAAIEQAAGSMYVSSQKSGSAVVTHANNGVTDRSFRMQIIS